MNPRQALLFCVPLLAAVACGSRPSSSSAPAKSGAVVATVGDETITADELKKRFDETSPFLRSRYNTLERKKEFLDNLVRNELLAQEARRQGFDKSAAVQEQTKRAMIQELIKHQLDEKLTGTDLTDADLKTFYEAHLDDFVKPERARFFHIFLPAKDGKEKEAARKQAAALLKDIDAREKKGEVNAFQAVAMKESKDPASAPMGGDLRFLSRDELAKAYNPQLASAAFEMNVPSGKAGPIDTPAGIELLKLQVKTVALNRSFDESKESIRGRMARERRSREYDEWIKKLHDSARIAINDAELDKVQVDGPVVPPGGPGAGIPGQTVSQQPPRPVTPPAAAAKIGGQ